MNPLAKALGTVFVLAAGALGTSLDTGFLPDIPGLPVHPASEGMPGNGTGNPTGGGNQTAGGDGNGTAGDGGGNETAGDDGNETAGDDGNETAGGDNETAEDDGNETADPDDDGAEPEGSSVCDFAVDEWSSDLTPQHHEWEWLVTRDVTSLSVEFQAYGGIPTSLGSHPEARLVDGSGRTLARSTGSDGGGISVHLERGTDYMASGQWRLVYDSGGDVWDDYSVSVHLGCAGEE